jgi:integrase
VPIRRQFGSVRRLPSKRWQASYTAPDTGERVNAPSTFDSKVDAGLWLSVVEAQIAGRSWRHPASGGTQLGQYIATWIAERPGLRPRSIETYEDLLRLHIDPHIGRIKIRDLTTARVRTWRAELLSAKVGESRAAKAYRLVRAALNTAAADGEIASNPCRVPGADKENAAERPHLSVEKVFDLADLMPPRWHAFVLVKAFGAARWGEMIALEVEDFDVPTTSLSISKAYTILRSGEMLLGPTKSGAGLRTAQLPDVVFAKALNHIDEFADSKDPHALVFPGPSGRPIRRSNFNRDSGWKAAAAKIGVPNFRVHDLRHTGNMIAAATPGTTIRDLMGRLGQSTERAAMIYLHKALGADKRFKLSMDEQIALLTAAGTSPGDRERPSVDAPMTDVEQKDILAALEELARKVRGALPNAVDVR